MVNGKSIRRKLHCDDHMTFYCKDPSSGTHDVYMLNRDEIGDVEKQLCDLCDRLEICNIYKSGLFGCDWINCDIEQKTIEWIDSDGNEISTDILNRHTHLLCDTCASKKN
jgi:hypothetical protein